MVAQMLYKRTQCRLCFSPLEDELYHQAETPVAGVYTESPIIGADTRFPFTVSRCGRCGLVQLKQSLSSSFYRHYAFAAGNAQGYKNYIEDFFHYVTRIFDKNHSILEIGCGDGSLLSHLAQDGFEVLGVEPAHLPAQIARQKGVQVHEDFFSHQTAAHYGITAHDVIIARHVLEHIDDVAVFFAAIHQASHENTWLLIEVPDLFSTLDASLGSNFYHSHVSYFAQDTLVALLSRYGWVAHQTSIVPVFGGSLLVLASRQNAPLRHAPLFGVPAQEVNEQDVRAFFSLWKQRNLRIQQTFEQLKQRGWQIAGYGAGERTGATFGAAGLTSGEIQCLYDSNASLHGRFLLGHAIPIKPPAAILDDQPDVIAIFATSHEEEIVKSQALYQQKGGRFLSMRSDPPQLLDLFHS